MSVARPPEAERLGPFRLSDASPLLRVVGLALALGFAFPGLYLVYRNFAVGADPAGLLLSDRTLGPLWRSLRLAVSVSGAALVLGTSLAWFTTRTDLPLRRLWRVLLPLPLVFQPSSELPRSSNPQPRRAGQRSARWHRGSTAPPSFGASTARGWC